MPGAVWKSWRIAAIVLVSPLVFLAGFIALVSGFNYIYTKAEERADIPFDYIHWDAGSRAKVEPPGQPSADAPRIKMCRDLIKRRILIGKTREEIMFLLGAPDNFPFKEPWQFNYWLGPQRGLMKMDSAWLGIRFGDDGRATEARMLQD